MSARGYRHVTMYGLVGAVGFAIDGGLLTVLARLVGLNLYLSRLMSFSAAVTATWGLNRTFVFGTAGFSGRKPHEYGRYLSVQVAGAALNLGVFAALVSAFPGLRVQPIIPLAAGAALGMVFNYAGARYWVFRPRRIS